MDSWRQQYPRRESCPPWEALRDGECHPRAFPRFSRGTERRCEVNPPKLIGEVTEIAKWGKVVATRTFEQPDGKQDEFLVWGGKKGDQFVVPSIIFPVTDKEEVIAIRQFRYGANEFVLEIPGGCPDGKEGFEGIVRRELLEEAGYEVGELRKLGEPLWFEPAACWTK